MERGVVSPPMVFAELGFALGKLGWLGSDSSLLEGLTELTLVLSTSRTSVWKGVSRLGCWESAFP